jgi:hypothetical protein
VVLPLLSILDGESCFLVSWCAGDGRDMAGSVDDHGRSWRPGAEDWGWSSTGQVLGGRTIERSGYIVCGLHCAQGDVEREFLALTSKPRSMVSLSLASKPMTSGFPL